MPETSKNTLKKRRQRTNIRNDPVRLDEFRKKDRERKLQSRQEKRQHMQSHPRLLQAARENKKLEMRDYRKKKKAAEAKEITSETRRSIAAKTREAKKKDKKRKAQDRLEKSVEKFKKKKAIFQTKQWRMKIKLRNAKEQEEQKNRGAQSFVSQRSEKTAVRKVKKTLPSTPQRRARVLQKLVESPTTVEILEKRGVILSQKTRRTLELGEEVLDSLSEQLDCVKHSGGTQPCQQTAYSILRSVVDKKRKKRITAALHSKLNLRKVKKQKQKNQWWQPKTRKQRKDSIPETVKQRVRDFYLSSEISREVPDKRAAIKVKEGGQVQLVERHNMCMILGDAYHLYKKMYPEDKIGLTAFSKLRPLQVMKVSETSRRTCLCQICCNPALKA